MMSGEDNEVAILQDTDNNSVISQGMLSEQNISFLNEHETSMNVDVSNADEYTQSFNTDVTGEYQIKNGNR